MSTRKSPSSTKAAFLITTTAATFLGIFIVTKFIDGGIKNYNLTGNRVLLRPFSDLNNAETPHPTTESPATIPPTKLIESNTETIPPSTAIPTNIPPTNTQMECPLPTTDSYGGVDSRQLGKVIEGETKNYTVGVQPVAMSHDGNRVILGNPWGADGGTIPEGPTTVKVFDFKGNTWDEAGTFSGRNEDLYGRFISLSGDGKRLAIGAWGSGSGIGHVVTYDFVKGTSWKSVGQKLTGVNTGDLFGRSISLSNDGNRMAIGAIQVKGGDNGSVNVYELEGDSWKQLGETILGAAADDWFGNAVSMSGDGSIVAVGAFRSDEKGPDSGSVRVFRYSSEKRTMQETQDKQYTQSSQDTGKWVQVGRKLLGGESSNYFGFSLSINKNGDTLAVGADGGNYVQIFRLDNNEWYPMGNKLVGLDNFGYSVFLAPSSNRLAVGTGDDNGGYVSIFDFDGNDWVQIGTINSPSSEKYFGTSVVLSNCGNRLGIGSIYETNGRLRIYEFN